jgi:GAF domain-containing protein
MTDPTGGRLETALAIGALAGEDDQAALLQSVVITARAIFAAAATSVLLVEPGTGELTFAAVAGNGEQELVGRRFPPGTGIGGWVVATGMPLLLEDVRSDPRFARDAARSTNYVPTALMASPLLYGETPIGVLEVLDWLPHDERQLEALDLLGLFAHQAAIAVRVVRGAAAAQRSLAGEDAELGVIARVATRLRALDGARRESGMHLMTALEEVLT